MKVGRRGFLTTVAAGSAACVVGCNEMPVIAGDDAGPPPCPLPPATTPPPLDYPAADYFEQISLDLNAAGIGTPIVFVDLQRMAMNIDLIKTGVQPLSYRIVEKSLPSIDLLREVSAQSRSSKFLVLHLPFLAPLLAAFPTAEVLLGKAHLTSAVASFFDTLPVGTDRVAVANRVTFIADGADRMNQLLALAQSKMLPLRVAVEIDVGLRRSGVSTPAELPAVLDVFSHPEVQFAGFLGYDGHIAHGPAGTPAALDAAFGVATGLYQSFVDVLTRGYGHLVSSSLIFNSGGSPTYPMYANPPAGVTTPVNDVAAGGGVLRPGDYPDFVISSLKPAIFIATPVLAQYAMPQLPFFTPAESAAIFPGQQGLTIYGGGWPAFYTYPPEIKPAPFVSDATDPAMVPNQGLVTAPATTALGPGDWVYYHPRQSDALFQFQEIYRVDGGRLQSSTWAAYPRRY